MQTSETATTGKESELKPGAEDSQAELVSKSIAEKVRKTEAKDDAKTEKDPEDDNDFRAKLSSEASTQNQFTLEASRAMRKGRH